MQIPALSSITSDQILAETMPSVQKVVDLLSSNDNELEVAAERAIMGTQLAIVKLLQEIKAQLGS